MNEVSWTKLFAYDTPTDEKAPKAKKCTCGNSNCKHAKKIRCVCQCHAENHGIEQRRGMEPLDKALGLEREQPPGHLAVRFQRERTVGDLALALELSGDLSR